jgi:hypothetical protein
VLCWATDVAVMSDTHLPAIAAPSSAIACSMPCHHVPHSPLPLHPLPLCSVQGSDDSRSTLGPRASYDGQPGALPPSGMGPSHRRTFSNASATEQLGYAASMASEDLSGLSRTPTFGWVAGCCVCGGVCCGWCVEHDCMAGAWIGWCVVVQLCMSELLWQCMWLLRCLHCILEQAAI